LIVELWVGDAELGDIARNLQPDSVDAVYTDPPWNEGIGKIFRGWADAKDGQFSLEGLMRSTCSDLYRVCPTGPWFVEVGPNDEAWLEHVSAWRDGAVSVPATWGSGREPKLCHTICVGEATPPRLHGEETTRAAFDIMLSHGVDSVVDPFIGKGLTIRHALPLGISVYGMELNPKRLAEAQKTADKLIKEMM
jgi:DNA modification methylase